MWMPMEGVDTPVDNGVNITYDDGSVSPEPITFIYFLMILWG